MTFLEAWWIEDGIYATVMFFFQGLGIGNVLWLYICKSSNSSKDGVSHALCHPDRKCKRWVLDAIAAWSASTKHETVCNGMEWTGRFCWTLSKPNDKWEMALVGQNFHLVFWKVSGPIRSCIDTVWSVIRVDMYTHPMDSTDSLQRVVTVGWSLELRWDLETFHGGSYTKTRGQITCPAIVPPGSLWKPRFCWGSDGLMLRGWGTNWKFMGRGRNIVY